jgi:O-antigen/teichoic acid export membrane protein
LTYSTIFYTIALFSTNGKIEELEDKALLMHIDNDKYIDFSLLQKETLIPQPVSDVPQPEFPIVPRTPKKTRLERMPLKETTSAMLQAIKIVRAELLIEYFEQTCDRRPHGTALICASSQLTYQELDQQANRFANFLISCGVGNGNPVGILLERSLDTYVALLGILKAGAVFVPIDPSFRAEQVAFIAEDAGLRYLVTTSAFRDRTSAPGCPVIELDQVYEVLSVQNETRPQVHVDPSALCYLIYMLDATDQPKRVAISHANAVSFLRAITPIYGVMRNDRVYQEMPIFSDFSFEEIWPTWIAGATLVASPTNAQCLGQRLTEFLITQKISVFFCVPMQLATIERDVPSLRAIFVVREICPADLVRQWVCPGRRLLDTYSSVMLHPVWRDQSPSYGSKPDESEQIALPQVDQVSLNKHTPAPQVKTSATSDSATQTSWRKALSQMNFTAAYKLVMSDPLFKNSLFNMASTFIMGGLGFVFWIVVARLYNTEMVGIATTLISIMTLLSSFTTLGLNSSLMRYLPKSTNKNELINSSFAIVTFAALLVSMIFLLGLQFFSPQLVFLQSNFFYILSFTIFIVFCSWNTLVESISMAFRYAGNILIKNSIISILKLILPFVFIGLAAYGIFVSTAAALALGVVTGLSILILKFKIRPSISINVSFIKETSIYSFANYMTGFMFNMPSLVLPVIILNVLSARYAAYYYVASMIQNILLIIPLATTQSLLTEGSYDEAGLKKHVKKALITILVTLVPATAVIVFAGNILLQFFGKSYADEAFEFLQLYSASTIFTAILMISNAIMNVKHQVKTLVALNSIASILTLWLSYAFISGRLVGVGWGFILGQAIAGLISIFFIIRNVYV